MRYYKILKLFAIPYFILSAILLIWQGNQLIKSFMGDYYYGIGAFIVLLWFFIILFASCGYWYVVNKKIEEVDDLQAVIKHLEKDLRKEIRSKKIRIYRKSDE